MWILSHARANDFILPELSKSEISFTSVFSLLQVSLEMLVLPVRLRCAADFVYIYSERHPSFTSAQQFFKIVSSHSEIQIVTQMRHRVYFLWPV